MKRDHNDELLNNFIDHMRQYFNDMRDTEYNKIDPVVFEKGWPD